MGGSDFIMGLSRPLALEITDGQRRCFGGDQAWFRGTDCPKAERLVKKGCAVTAAANILAYISANGRRAALRCTDMSRAGFTAYMREVSQYLSPGIAGIWRAQRFARGAKAFAASRGVTLRADILRHFGTEEAAEFIGKSLRADIPVAMLIGFNKTLKSAECTDCAGSKSAEKLTAHWVTVTELARRGGEYAVKISTWGKYAYVSLADYAGNERFMKALVSLHV